MPGECYRLFKNTDVKSSKQKLFFDGKFVRSFYFLKSEKIHCTQNAIGDSATSAATWTGANSYQINVITIILVFVNIYKANTR